jgi:TRAP-type uncharacterized transport system fused permease subunit
MADKKIQTGFPVSEERIVPDTAQFRSIASKATIFWTNVFQVILIGVVVLWVLDIPRQVFNVSLYVEQLLAICLGLTLALAFTVETSRRATRFDWAGAIAVLAILAYIAFRHRALSGIPPALIAGLVAALIWTFASGLARTSRYFDIVAVIISLVICAYIAIRYETLTYELAHLPTDGVIGSAILVYLVLDGSRRTSGWGFVAIILALAVYIYISPHFSGDFATRSVSPERLVAYLGLDVNGIIGAILAIAVLIVIPFTIMGQVLARTGGADFFADLAMSVMGGLRGGAAKISIFGSALFGTISGSAVSNVLAVAP